MPEVNIAPTAQADIDEIAFRIGLDNQRAMLRWLLRVRRAFQLIGAFPNCGPERSDLSSGLRSFPVGAYLIFYRVEKENVEILRMIHGARDLPAIFGE